MLLATVDFLQSGRICLCCETTSNKNCFCSSLWHMCSLNSRISAMLLSAVPLTTLNSFPTLSAAIWSLSYGHISWSVKRNAFAGISSSVKKVRVCLVMKELCFISGLTDEYTILLLFVRLITPSTVHDTSCIACFSEGSVDESKNERPIICSNSYNKWPTNLFVEL